MVVLLVFGCGTAPEVSDSRANAFGDGSGIDPLRELAAGLLPVGHKVPGPLAIGDFLLSGKPSDLGEELCRALPAHLSRRTPDLEIISYRNLQSVLEARKLQMEDLFLDSGSDPGDLLPARSLLIGFLFPHGDASTVLEAQVIDLKSGAILTSARARFQGRRARSGNPYSELPLEVEFRVTARMRGLDGEFLVREGDTLHTGDRVRIRLKPNRPAHLYLFLLDSQGEAHLLFPGSAAAPARLEAGELLLPSSEEYYLLDRHPGTESLVVAASLVPMDGLEDLVEKLGGEAAGAADLLDVLNRSGRRGFVGVSRPADTEESLSEIMRSYSGTVWRRFSFVHRP